MAPPQISEDEIDDLLYFARAGETDELTTLLTALSEREKVSPAEILSSAKDEGKSTCLHMATGNGHLGMLLFLVSVLLSFVGHVNGCLLRSHCTACSCVI